jgi:hypothetical protein
VETTRSHTLSKAHTEMETFTDALASSNLTLLASMIVLGSSLSKAWVINQLRACIGLYPAVVQKVSLCPVSVQSPDSPPNGERTRRVKERSDGPPDRAATDRAGRW